jgi:WD40 repeat protein
MTRIPAVAVCCLACLPFARAGEPDQPRVVAPAQTWEGHKAPVYSLAFHPEGKVLASAAGYPKGNIFLWDVGSGKVTGTLAPTNGRSVAFSPDGKPQPWLSGEKPMQIAPLSFDVHSL